MSSRRTLPALLLTLIGARAHAAPPPDESVCDTHWCYAADADGDGYGTGALRRYCYDRDPCPAVGGDCNDWDASVHPNATETCNGRDDDCDGQTDEGLNMATYYRDADSDRYGDPKVAATRCTQPSGYVRNRLDCDDTRASVHPRAAEVCDALDNDCDGTVDEGLVHTYYTDGDGDGYGDATVPVAACTAPAGTTTDATDCDDANADVHPGAAENCNDTDDNCDGSIDEGSVVVGANWIIAYQPRLSEDAVTVQTRSEAAFLLQEYIALATGLTLDAVELEPGQEWPDATDMSDREGVIFVGETNALHLAYTDLGLGAEEYVLAYDARGAASALPALFIAGPDTAGNPWIFNDFASSYTITPTLYGLAALLEGTMGFHWYFPGDDGVTWHKSVLAIPACLFTREAPATRYRRFTIPYFETSFTPYGMTMTDAKSTAKAWAIWQRLNYLGMDSQIWHKHNVFEAMNKLDFVGDDGTLPPSVAPMFAYANGARGGAGSLGCSATRAENDNFENQICVAGGGGVAGETVEVPKVRPAPTRFVDLVIDGGGGAAFIGHDGAQLASDAVSYRPSPGAEQVRFAIRDASADEVGDFVVADPDEVGADSLHSLGFLLSSSAVANLSAGTYTVHATMVPTRAFFLRSGTQLVDDDGDLIDCDGVGTRAKDGLCLRISVGGAATATATIEAVDGSGTRTLVGSVTHSTNAAGTLEFGVSELAAAAGSAATGQTLHVHVNADVAFEHVSTGAFLTSWYPHDTHHACTTSAQSERAFDRKVLLYYPFAGTLPGREEPGLLDVEAELMEGLAAIELRFTTATGAWLGTMGLAHNDSDGHCQCDLCRALDCEGGDCTASDAGYRILSSTARNTGRRMYDFSIRMQALLNRHYAPGLALTTYAYGDFILPSTSAMTELEMPGAFNLLDVHNGSGHFPFDHTTAGSDSEGRPTNACDASRYRMEQWATEQSEDAPSAKMLLYSSVDVSPELRGFGPSMPAWGLAGQIRSMAAALAYGYKGAYLQIAAEGRNWEQSYAAAHTLAFGDTEADTEALLDARAEDLYGVEAATFVRDIDALVADSAERFVWMRTNPSDFCAQHPGTCVTYPLWCDSSLTNCEEPAEGQIPGSSIIAFPRNAALDRTVAVAKAGTLANVSVPMCTTDSESVQWCWYYPSACTQTVCENEDCTLKHSALASPCPETPMDSAITKASPWMYYHPQYGILNEAVIAAVGTQRVEGVLEAQNGLLGDAEAVLGTDAKRGRRLQMLRSRWQYAALTQAMLRGIRQLLANNGGINVIPSEGNGLWDAYALAGAARDASQTLIDGIEDPVQRALQFGASVVRDEAAEAPWFEIWIGTVGSVLTTARAIDRTYAHYATYGAYAASLSDYPIRRDPRYFTQVESGAVTAETLTRLHEDGITERFVTLWNESEGPQTATLRFHNIPLDAPVCTSACATCAGACVETQAFDLTDGGAEPVTFQLDCSASDGYAYAFCETVVSVADGFTLYSVPSLNFVPAGWARIVYRGGFPTSLTLSELCGTDTWLRTYASEDGQIQSGSYRVSDAGTGDASMVAATVGMYGGGNHHVDLSNAAFRDLGVIAPYCDSGAHPTAGDHPLLIEALMVDDVGAVGRSAMTLTVRVP